MMPTMQDSKMKSSMFAKFLNKIYWLYTYMYLYLPSSLLVQHDVATRFRQPVLSLTFVSVSPRVMFSSFRSA